MALSDHAFATTPDGIAIRFRLTPRSAQNRIGGLVETADGPAVQARVRALPENGAANAALISLCAKWISIPKSSIALSAGAKSRIKVLNVSGDSCELTRLVSGKIGASHD